MKKRFLMVIAALVLAFATAFAFVACGDDSTSGGGYTGADGTYYFYEEHSSGDGTLDTDVYFVISGGKITTVVRPDMSDDLPEGAKISSSGGVSRDGSVSLVTKMSYKVEGVTLKYEARETGNYANGVIHITHIVMTESMGEMSDSQERDISLWYCQEDKTPADFEGGSENPPGEDDPVNPSGAGTSRENAIAATLNTQYSINIRNGVGNMWYSFTPSEDGVYFIRSSNNNSYDTYVELYEGNSTSTLETDDDDGGDRNFMIQRSLTGGTTYYIYARGYDRAASLSFTMTITMLEHSTRGDAIPLSLNTEVRASFELGNQVIWYSFTPTTSGTYAFSSDVDDYEGTPYAALYRGTEDTPLVEKSSDDRAFNLSYDMTAGTTYYLAARCSYSTGYINLTVTQYDGTSRARALVAVVGRSYPVAITTGGQSVWFAFTPVRSGRYIIESTECTGNPYGAIYRGNETSAIDYNDDADEDDSNFCMIKDLTAGTTYYVEAKMATAGGTGSYTFKVSEPDGTTRARAIPVVIDTDYNVGVATANQSVWYTFTPTRDGEYTVYSTGNTGDPIASLYTAGSELPVVSDDDGGSGQNFSISYEMNFGSTYYIEAKIAGTGTGSYILRVAGEPGTTRANPIAVVLGQEYAVSIQKSHDGYWFTYTPAETGTYVMYSKNYSGGDPYGELYSGTDEERITYNDDYGGGRNFLIRYELTAGTTYYVNARQLNTNTGSYTFVMERADGSTRAQAIIASQDVAYNVAITTVGGEMWYMFTPSESGEYMIYSSDCGTSDPVCSVYSGSNSSVMISDDNSGNGNNFSINTNLSSGTTYYIRLTNNATGSYKLTVSKTDGTTRARAYSINADTDGKRVIIETAGQSVWFRFTPTLSGDYTFRSLDDYGSNPMAKLYEGNGTTPIAQNDDLGADNRNFLIRRTLTADTTYYIEVKMSSANETGEFRFRVIGIPGSVRGNAIETTLDAENTVTIQRAGQHVWYSFTPTVSANYTIASTGNSAGTDPIARVYNENSSNYSYSNDNKNSPERNFEINCALTGGTTYYIEAYMVNGADAETGTYTMTVKFAKGSSRSNPIIASIGTSYNVSIGASGVNVWYSFTPDVTTEYTISSSGPAQSSMQGDPYCTIYQGASTTELVHQDNASSDTVDFSITRELTAGVTYYIEASMSAGRPTGSYTLRITGGPQGATRADPLAAALDTPYNVTTTAAQNSVWYSYTPSNAGEYIISMTGANTDSAVCNIYSGNNAQAMTLSYNSNSNNYGVLLSSGTTYYIELGIRNQETGSFSFTISLKPGSTRATAIVASVGVTYDVIIAINGGAVWFSFTPTITATYVLESTDYSGNADPKAFLYQDSSTSVLEEDDDDGNSNNFRISRSLSAGTTYYLKAAMYNDSKTGSYKFSITRN